MESLLSFLGQFRLPGETDFVHNEWLRKNSGMVFHKKDLFFSTSRKALGNARAVLHSEDKVGDHSSASALPLAPGFHQSENLRGWWLHDTVQVVGRARLPARPSLLPCVQGQENGLRLSLRNALCASLICFMSKINLFDSVAHTRNLENLVAVDIGREGEVAGRRLGEVENVLHRRRASTTLLVFAVHLDLWLVGQRLNTYSREPLRFYLCRIEAAIACLAFMALGHGEDVSS